MLLTKTKDFNMDTVEQCVDWRLRTLTSMRCFLVVVVFTSVFVKSSVMFQTIYIYMVCTCTVISKHISKKYIAKTTQAVMATSRWRLNICFVEFNMLGHIQVHMWYDDTASLQAVV